LLCGDSTDSEQVAKLMNGEKADMVFTDPPYDFTDNSKYTDILLNNTENAHIFVMHDDAGIVDYLRNSKLKFKQFFVADFNFASPRGNDPYLRHILISHEENGDAIKHQNFHDGLSSIIKMEYRGNLKDEKTIHKHQKSVEFISKFVKHYSNENDIILDLFLGSGSTMVAAHQLKRKCYGVEIDPIYCQIIIDRMRKLDDSLTIKKNGVII
jgi:DNA modification methylase